MTEITGLKCSTKGCGARTFLEDPDAVNWLTSVMTSPGQNFRRKVHYCPPCAVAQVDSTEPEDERLSSGQQKVINPGFVDPALQDLVREHQDLNRADADRAGLDTAWEPAAPAPAPATPGRGNVVIPAPVPVAVGGDPTQPTDVVRMKSAVPSPSETSWPGWPGGSPQATGNGNGARKKRRRGDRVGAAVTAVTSLLLTVALLAPNHLLR